MLKKKAEIDTQDQPEVPVRLVTQASDMVKAREWFRRARELSEKRNYDHAVEYYVGGLEYWPDAVEEACMPLHACAVARKQSGGAKPSMMDGMKRRLSDKAPLQSYINALWLFGHDPDNTTYIEGVFNYAVQLNAMEAALWASGVFFKTLETTPKPGAKQFRSFVDNLEQFAERAAAWQQFKTAETLLDTGVRALNLLMRRLPKEKGVDTAVRNLSTKLTIMKGKYQTGESYRESIADSERQMELHDQERTIQSADRLDELIESARQRYEAAPDNPEAIKKYVDLLTRRELEEHELKAIGLLVDAFKKLGDYRYKARAQDIRMKQLGRAVRDAERAGDAEQVRQKLAEQVKFELSVYRERAEKYPTDNRIKYEYAVRCFQSGRLDDAIPLLQSARLDPKNRVRCSLFLGRCFYAKKYFKQAIASFEEGLAEHPFQDDELAKEMLYGLALAQADDGNAVAARQSLGRLLQLDYNYRDVRERLDSLPADV